MDKQLIINVLSPYQHKAIQIPKGWDFKVKGSPMIPAHGARMVVYANGEPIEIPFTLGVSSVIRALKGLKIKEFIVEYFSDNQKICELGCRKVRDHVESKPVRKHIMF